TAANSPMPWMPLRPTRTRRFSKGSRRGVRAFGAAFTAGTSSAPAFGVRGLFAPPFDFEFVLDPVFDDVSEVRRRCGAAGDFVGMACWSVGSRRVPGGTVNTLGARSTRAEFTRSCVGEAFDHARL